MHSNKERREKEIVINGHKVKTMIQKQMNVVNNLVYRARREPVSHLPLCFSEGCLVPKTSAVYQALERYISEHKHQTDKVYVSRIAAVGNRTSELSV